MQGDSDDDELQGEPCNMREMTRWKGVSRRQSRHMLLGKSKIKEDEI